MILSTVLAAACANTPASQPSHASQVVAGSAQFGASGELRAPSDYRSWVYLTTGFEMAYGPAAVAQRDGGVATMDNVFVEKWAYDGFVANGVWPEHTRFALEIRAGEHTGSIVTTGHFQTDLAGLEVEVKDTKQFANGWGFFAFQTDGAGPVGTATLLPQSAACYACHAKNAAVENTFTQFYPTLFSVARAKGTVRKDFIGIPPSTNEVAEEVTAHGWASARIGIDAALAKWPDANIGREFTLNGLGYRLLATRQEDALAIFEYVTQRFAGSANAWDSLAEAYDAAKQRDKARAAAAKGLDALVDDPIAGQARERLEQSLRARL